MPLVPSSRHSLPTAASYQQGPTSVSSSSAPRGQRTTRRTKAHVAKACQNCKKAHLSCDEARPCARCVASGKQVSWRAKCTQIRTNLILVIVNMHRC
jgi:hypothetical protein